MAAKCTLMTWWPILFNSPMNQLPDLKLETNLELGLDKLELGLNMLELNLKKVEMGLDLGLTGI